MRVTAVVLACVSLLAALSAGGATLSKRDKKGSKKKAAEVSAEPTKRLGLDF